MNIENLNRFERDLLLHWFLYYMPMGSTETVEPTHATRFELMRQFPAIYNKLADTEIVRVLHVSSNSPA
jgi:hypothetical protein